MKVFTMAAALDAGTVKLTDLFYCHGGEFKVDDLVIRDAHRDEWLSPIQILQRSSNIGITKVAFQTGKVQLYKILKRFGYGEKTGIPFPGETGGMLRHYSQWYNVDFASISYGHGIGVSVIQLAMAVSAIANGGKLLQPILVKKIVSSKGTTVKEFQPTLVRKVIEPKTARILAKMMVAVTQEGGTGVEAAIDGFLVSGKTGTAQKPDTISGGYTKDRWIASFVGFVPTDDPQIAMAIMFDEPLINYYGGVVAAPLFRRVAEKALRHLGVTPKLAPKEAGLKPQETAAPSAAPAEGAAGETGDPSKEGGEAAAEGGGPAAPSGAPQGPGEAPATCTGDCVVMPAFTGLSLPAAINLSIEKGVTIKVVGSGRAGGQSVPAGASVPRGSGVTVQFGAVSIIGAAKME
jgi:cell division protein FtsI (penicillin-binding protein 3)